MIIYATKDTIKKYNIPMPDELSVFNGILAKRTIEEQSGDRLLEWGIKYYNFMGLECIQCVNFASKLTICLYEFNQEDLPYIGDMIIRYILDIYNDNEEMQELVKKFCDDYPILAFSRLTDEHA